MAIKEIFDLGELFHQVQMNNIFADGKTFPDCLPLQSLDEINNSYHHQKNSAGFDLQNFVYQNFQPPEEPATEYESNTAISIEKHIEGLWNVLLRGTDLSSSSPMRAPVAVTRDGVSLIALPNPYIVPGGRFREIYYWDSYFAMLGLQVSKRMDIIESMLENFTFLIHIIGYIPNGSRTYYKGRSQPPFFSLMVQLLAEEKGSEILVKYLPAIEKEYQFWMMGADELSDENNSYCHLVRMPDGSLLNRYWDENNTPRPESYKEDIELAHHSEDKETMYRHIRAAAESGWDFSCRWFKDINNFASIHTTDIIPVDLNCLLFCMEETLAEAYKISGSNNAANLYHSLAVKRKAAIQKYCWNEDKGFYFDYDFIAGKQTEVYTLAAIFPLFFRVASITQAESIAFLLHRKFLKSGGLVTTPETTGQQWDAPNGWAPLQWMAIKGLNNYGMFSLAALIARQWIQLNKKVYKATGKLMEKYNVTDTDLLAGGGEYPSQDGFGWTNGVLLKLMKEYTLP